MKQLLKILLILLLVTPSLQAQDDLPNPMSPPRLVNDFAELFSQDQYEELEHMLRAYNDTTSTQIYVVTVTDLKGYDVSDFAFRLGEKWGIGQKDKNNGVLILIKPRIGNERGRVFIATGYGVEHILTDARCGRIIDEYMMPYLQEGDYYNASKSASKVIMQYLSGEFKADDEATPVIPLIVSILFILLFLYIASKGNRGGGPTYWPRGGFGGGGSSSGGFGGGFSGGGGGSFGGGGAGRSF